MAKKRGVKPRKDGPRQPNGQLRRASPHNPYNYRRRLDGFGFQNVEQYDDKEVVSVARAKNLHQDSHEHPLRVLYVLQHITGSQRDRGEEFGNLYWRLFGAPNARAQDFLAAGGVTHRDPVVQLADERRYADCLKALDDSGARKYVVLLAAYLEPGWLIPQLIAQGIGATLPRGGRHDRRVRLIIRGLDALENVARPRISDEERERVLREVA